MSENLKDLLAKRCKVEFVDDPVTGWKLRLETLSPACRDSLHQASQNMGPHAKKFLGKRLEAANAEVSKELAALGLKRITQEDP